VPTSDIVRDLKAGKIAPDVAKKQLVKRGLERSVADALVNAATPPPPSAPVTPAPPPAPASIVTPPQRTPAAPPEAKRAHPPGEAPWEKGPSDWILGPEENGKRQRKLIPLGMIREFRNGRYVLVEVSTGQVFDLKDGWNWEEE